VLPIDALIAGSHPFPVAEAMYQRPAATVANALLLGPILGAGREALRLVVEKAPTKPIHHTFFARQSDSVGAQIQIAEAAMKLKTARFHVYDVAETLDNATTGEEVPYARRAEIRAQLSHAAQEALAAINILVNVHGAGTFAESNRLQQLWRDANTAARHAALNPYVGYEVHGKDLLGIAERVSPMV
jgi:3-hydroxy-9,10-secoandrosta-1,3,5(10)-triene-9,17-dione monooxygenase